MRIRSLALTLLTGAVIVAGGCKSYDDYKAERYNKAVLHFERAQYTAIAPDKVLSLNEC